MIRATFIGHAAWMFQSPSHCVVIDPFFDGNPQATIRKEDIKPDYVIVTHAHGDHWGDALWFGSHRDSVLIANFEICTYAEKHGMKTHSMHVGGGHTFLFGHVKLTPAFHGSSFPDGTYGGMPAGVVLTLDGKRIYHTGDTGLFSDMKLVAREPVDLMLVPIGDNYTMGIEDAVTAAEWVQPRCVVPMHYDTWEIIRADAKQFISRIDALGLNPRILNPGETMEMV